MKENYFFLSFFFLFTFFGYSQTNLIANGDLESWTNNQLDTWIQVSPTIIRSQTEYNNGVNSLQIFKKSTSEISNIKTVDLNLVAGKIYILKYDTKIVTDQTSYSGKIYGSTSKITHQGGSGSYSPSIKANSWRTITLKIEASGTQPYTIEFYHNNGQTVGITEAVFLDNIKLYELDTLNENTGDKNSLITFYNSTQGANWTKTWDLTEEMFFWEGVTTNDQGRVTGISLESNNLIGTLPVELGNLTELEFFDINRTYRSGEINNQISGTIPNELGNLVKLRELNLAYFDFNGNIPPEFGGLINLEHLLLNNNNLTGNLPEELGALANLKVLDFSSNQIEGNLPSSFYQLSNLTNLRLAHNKLNGVLTSEIGQLTMLEQLNLSFNNFTGNIPNEITTLTNLTYLQLGKNQLTGEIQNQIGQLTNLKSLSLASNNLSGAIPTTIGQLTKLENLDFSFNQLAGVIPSTIGQLTNLIQLNLRSNLITGPIPKEIGQINSLSRIFMSNLRLTGIIPAELGQLSNLTNLSLKNNQLTGTLPNELNQLTNLTGFSISNNLLEGKIDSSFSNLQNLTSFYIADNNFSGTLPNFSQTIPYYDIKNNNFIFEDILETVSSQPDIVYSPQAKIELEDTITLNEGEEFAISVTATSSSQNTYQWRKNGTDIPNETGATLTIPNISATNSGDYDCLINNTSAPDLRLTKNTISLQINESDDDNDGIVGSNDLCPNTPSGETVDTNGCSQSQLDDDNDGVTNNNDNCPNTPSGNTVDINGCIINNPNQVNYLQNFSFEDWSGNPENPDSWAFENANNITKTTEATDGSFSLELELDNSLQNKTELYNTNTVRLATNETYTYTFDYKIKRGTQVSAEIHISKDGNTFGIPIANENISFDLDGNWHTFSVDFNTNTIDEFHIFKLIFRANTSETGIIILDNMRVLGNPLPDEDNDGVLDAVDQCPNTPPSAIAVDDNGCEVDVDTSNLIIDPSFEDWSYGGGSNLANWGINLISGSGWNKNEDVSDQLNYSNELTTSTNGTKTASIFQNKDLELYKNIEYTIGLDYKVLSGTFDKIKIQLTTGIFQDAIKEFTVDNFQNNWVTFATTFKLDSNQTCGITIEAISTTDGAKILIDNTQLKVNIVPSTLDSDNDGVNDDIDNCPNTPIGETVNTNGCSESQLDDDNDGVNNDIDQCPNTPDGYTVNPEGCQLTQAEDSDNDGINDDDDECPNTPTGEAVNLNGCSESQLDDDNDGVNNDIDQCPNTPDGYTVNPEGCQLTQAEDSDNDGINDDVDECPNTPTGEAVNVNGCSESQLDDDNDGVTNDVDECPNTPTNETVDTKGCGNNQASSPELESNDITTKATSTSCQSKNNGKIEVSFNKNYTYIVNISGSAFNETYNNLSMQTGLLVTNLATGEYTVCVTIPEFSTFEQCFSVKIETPEDFNSGKINIDHKNKVAKLVVSGSKNYQVQVNDIKMSFNFSDTGNHELTFNVTNGINTIKTSTDKICQGSYEETILVNSISIYPNPASDYITINGLKNMGSNEAIISFSDLSGKSIYETKAIIKNATAELSIAILPVGIYILHIQSKEQSIKTKIVKK